MTNDKRYGWRSTGDVSGKVVGVSYSCFAASGTSILHKVGGIMKKEDYLQILQLCIKEGGT